MNRGGNALRRRAAPIPGSKPPLMPHRPVHRRAVRAASDAARAEIDPAAPSPSSSAAWIRSVSYHGCSGCLVEFAVRPLPERPVPGTREPRLPPRPRLSGSGAVEYDPMARNRGVLEAEAALGRGLVGVAVAVVDPVAAELLRLRLKPARASPASLAEDPQRRPRSPSWTRCRRPRRGRSRRAPRTRSIAPLASRLDGLRQPAAQNRLRPYRRRRRQTRVREPIFRAA